MKPFLLFSILLFFITPVFSQTKINPIAKGTSFELPVISSDSLYLKVHFLYGSKPLKQYRPQEKKWFGGILGGHVGIQCDSNKTVDFVTNGSFHLFSSKHKRHSRYTEHTIPGFYSILGGDPDSMKKAIVYVPISKGQKERFDSLTTIYLKQTPYDYAFFGMRCSAAAYDILGQLDVVPYYAQSKIYKKIFYPKKLRKRLFKMAKENGWAIEKCEGSCKRRWERD